MLQSSFRAKAPDGGPLSEEQGRFVASLVQASDQVKAVVALTLLMRADERQHASINSGCYAPAASKGASAMAQLGMTLAEMRAARVGLQDWHAREVIALCGTSDLGGLKGLAVIQLAIQAFDEVIVTRETNWIARL